ncbi:hypothetical protein [Streptomyces sp. NPDC021562]|uniref:hypothetical protein n=1 Tax=Streptomyces sp. NPDC021562 TaxID=3155121 RepID=UPI0033E6D599
MNKLAKRIALAVSSVAVAGSAVLGAGGTASAASLDDSWDHGVGYLLERGYSCDETRGWHQDRHGSDSVRHDCDGLYYRDGHFYRWDDEGHGWTSDSSYRHDGNRSERDGADRHHHDPVRDDR